MKRKAKYNYNNSFIVIAYKDNKAENTTDKMTNESMLDYIDKLFCSFESGNKKILYKVYTSKLSRKEAIKKFPKLSCDVCGSITNLLFITYRGYYCVGRSIECTICYPEYDFFASDIKGLKTILKLMKYNEVKKYKKYFNENYPYIKKLQKKYKKGGKKWDTEAM